MLGLYDEALVQYDELDALFTQFVLNSNVGGTVIFKNLVCIESVYYTMRTDIEIQSEKPKYR